MTVTVREQARRCERCGKVTVTVRKVSVSWDGAARVASLLCLLCRGDLRDSLDSYMRKGARRAA